MTPHEARPGVGTLKIDLRLGKYGRFNRATGTKDQEKAKDITATLRRLARERRYDLLGPMVQGIVTPLELHEAIWRQRADQLPTIENVWPLHRMARRWVEQLDRADRTRDEYERVLLALGDDDTKLEHVPGLLAEARSAAMKSGKRPTFNRLHSAVSMLFQSLLGEQHALTGAIARVERLTEDRREGNPQSLAQVHAIVQGLGEHGANCWPLSLTGMRTDEYFQRRYRPVADAAEILGTKSKAAKRAVPLAYPITAPTCSADHFRHRLHTLTDGEVRPHDLRYTFMRWAENAGIPDLRIRWYAGHAVKSVSELYRRGRGFQEFLREDAERLRAYFGEPPASGLRVVRA